MNSLVGLGAATSFSAGAAALLVPGMELEPSFLEEPVMLLAIVLLGRTLEARARVKAQGAAHPPGRTATPCPPPPRPIQERASAAYCAARSH